MLAAIIGGLETILPLTRSKKTRDARKRRAAAHGQEVRSGLVQAMWAIPTLLAASSIAAYANTFTAPFIFDDKAAILNNWGIRGLWPIWPALWAPAQTATSGRPVVSFTFALNYAFGGYDVWGYHALNLAVHIANAFLVYALLRRTLEGCENLVEEGVKVEWLAGSAALLWSAHPLLSESVAYIMQRTELLVAFFFLLTLYALRRSAAPSPAPRWAVLAVVSCALGMGCKEVMAAAPPAALLYDRIFLSPSFKDLLRRRWQLHAGLFSTWLILGALLATGPRTLSVGMTFRSVRPVEYLLTQAGVILHYLRLALYPHPLCLDYSDWPIVRSLSAAMPEAAVILGLLGSSLWALMRAPKLGFLGAWFFLILAPSSSIVPIVTEPAAERRMYLPLLSVVVIAVLGTHKLLRWGERGILVRRLEGTLLALVLAAFVAVTARRNESYLSETQVWSDVLAKRPHNARALNNLGAESARQGRPDEALPLFSRALEIDPGYAEAHNNLGGIYYNQGRMAEALDQFSQAVSLRPDYGEAHLNLGLALHNRGRLDEAIGHYLSALQLAPDDPEAHNHLGAALLSRGRTAEAIGHLREALRLRPGYPEAQRNLDRALASR